MTVQGVCVCVCVPAVGVCVCMYVCVCVCVPAMGVCVCVCVFLLRVCVCVCVCVQSCVCVWSCTPSTYSAVCLWLRLVHLLTYSAVYLSVAPPCPFVDPEAMSRRAAPP
jgi:hypothetical protein